VTQTGATQSRKAAPGEPKCPETSDAISTLDEALLYYRTKLVGAHKITCKAQQVVIVFEESGTHLFSESVDDINAIPEDALVTRNVGGSKRECRQFCLERAKLMDCVLPAISLFTRCTVGTGAPSRPNRQVHGIKMPCGRYMRVVLRPGKPGVWVCLSAFPIDEDAYRKTSWSKTAKFP
jgi:hypothetical protein